MNKNIHFRGVILAGVLLASSLVAVTSAETSAADNINLTLTPVSKSYTLDAGSVTQDEIKIINDGETAYTFSVYSKPYFVSDANYTAYFSPNRSNSDMHKWLKIDKSEYTIQPHETITIPYTMTVPADAAPGAHYGVIFAEADPPRDTLAGQTGIVTSQRVGTLLYSTVNGEYRTGGTVSSHSIPFFQFNPPLKAQLALQNSGNADYMAKTVMDVKDIFGNTKYTQANEYRVLADTTRNITFEWKTLPRFGLYKVSVSAEFLDEHTHRTSYVLMAPAWSYLMGVLVVLAGITYVVQKRR